MALAATGGSAWGQEDEGGEASSVIEAEKTPHLFVVGFEDADDEDCNPVYSRYGRCVEEVRFVDNGPAFDADSVPSDTQRGQWRNTARLYAELWEQMSYRWDIEDDPVASAYVNNDALYLPRPKQQWEATSRSTEVGDLSVYSLPRSSRWLLERQWVDSRVERDVRGLSLEELLDDSDGFFPSVRFKKASGLIPSEPMVVLKGRFAERLAVDNKLHPYDIMDGDPEASGPLFEQMYPYERGLSTDYEQEDDSEIPLTSFIVDEQLKVSDIDGDVVGIRLDNFRDALVPPSEDGFELMYDRASREFERFYELVGVQILRFAREEYTPTHLRVLTALMAMHSPPRYGLGGTVGAGDIVAAAKGQTDVIDPSLQEFRGYASSQGFALSFKELPEELIEKHIVTFPEWQNPSEDFKFDLLLEVIDNLEEHLRDGVRRNLDRYVFDGLDDASIKTWIKNNSFPGRGPIVAHYFKRIAIDLLVTRLDPEAREQIETEILLDHINLRIRQSFGGPDVPTRTPAQLEERTEAEWLQVLSTHGMFSTAIDDRPGAVDPVAICTRRDRRDALEEPSFGKVYVDELVVAPGWLQTTDELLWEVREKVPFVMLDDPARNPPAVTRLVGLPGDRAVYRIRWEIWSGWHLMWGVEPLSEDPDGPRRVALRTGAICADTVLASPELVPTLARAALLDGKFRPTVGLRKPNGKADVARKTKTNDQAVREADQAEDRVRNESERSQTIADAVGGDVNAIETVAGDLLSLFNRSGRRDKKKGPEIPTVTSEVVDYLEELMLAPIRALRGEKPLLVAVFDHGTPGPREKIWDFQPRTPYENAQVKVPDGHLRSSGWAMHIQSETAEFPDTIVAPAYLPTELLATSLPKQTWKRRRTSDWNFGGGLGFFPYRRVQYRCADAEDITDETAAAWAGTVTDCTKEDQDQYAGAENEGLALDLFALSTQWLVDDPRIAVEFGPEVRLDIAHRGRSWFYDGDRRVYGVTDAGGEDVIDRTQYSWTLRFQAGVLAGIRFAPDPAPLWRRGGRKLPWGSPLPDGGANLTRIQWGLRTGLLLGPSFDGLLGSTLLEAWMGWSVRAKQGKQASFTPYHPAILVGPFVRGMATFAFNQNSSRYYRLSYDAMAIVGIRAQFRLTAQPQPPELPSAEAPSLP